MKMKMKKKMKTPAPSAADTVVGRMIVGDTLVGRMIVGGPRTVASQKFMHDVNPAPQKTWQVLMTPDGSADTLIERGAKTGNGTPMVDFLKKHDRSVVVYEFEARTWDAAAIVMHAVRAGWEFRRTVTRRKTRKRKARR